MTLTNAAPAAEQVPVEHDGSTRETVLGLVAQIGPVTVTEMATRLELTSAAVRRHVSSLVADGRVVEHDLASIDIPRRGRPAKHYVAAEGGHAQLTDGYESLAASAMQFLANHLGPDAIDEFARARVAELEARYAPVIDAAGSDPQARVQALVDALTDDGYAATARPVSNSTLIQLCQGHCPVQQIAAEFPQLCDAETGAFSRLLGVHVQRLATLASGKHVCTTSIPARRAVLPLDAAGHGTPEEGR